MKKHWIRTALAIALFKGFGPAGADDPHTRFNTAQNRPQSNSPTEAAHSRASHQGTLPVGYSAADLIGMDVESRDGQAIGDVLDLAFDSGGRVAGVLISAGGILGIRETTYRLTWSHIDIARNGDHMRVPFSSHTALLFRWGAEDVDPHAKEVLAADLIGGSIALRDGMRAGIVEDLIIGPDGRLDTLIVSSDLIGNAFANYAYPFRGKVKFNPAAAVYTADIGYDEARQLPRFKGYDTLDVDTSVGASSGTTGSGRTARAVDAVQTLHASGSRAPQ